MKVFAETSPQGCSDEGVDPGEALEINKGWGRYLHWNHREK